LSLALGLDHEDKQDFIDRDLGLDCELKVRFIITQSQDFQWL